MQIDIPLEFHVTLVKMITQYVKKLRPLPDDPGSIPRTHIVEGERIHFYKLSFDFHMCAIAYTDAHMHTHVNK